MIQKAYDIVDLFRMLQDIARKKRIPAVDSNDIVHDTWLRILKTQHFESFSSIELPNPISRSYATQAIKWTILNQMRSNSTPLESFSDRANELESHYVVTPTVLYIQILREIWNTINPKDQKLLKQLYIDGCSITEVAQNLSISEAALRKRLSRLRKTLKDRFHSKKTSNNNEIFF